MAVVCPHCQHAAQVKSAKPGRFTPKCPKCGKAFVVIVPPDPNEAWSVLPLRPEETRAPAATEKSLPPRETLSPEAAADATSEFDPAGTQARVETRREASEATGAYAPGDRAPEATSDFDPQKATRKADDQPKKRKRPQEAEVPDRLGGYEVLDELGRGGMGAVYLARQLSLDRNVALKVMRPEWAQHPRFVARFTREAFAAAQLVHHNVVQIYDIGVDKDIHFFSMEFVKGQTLTGLLRKSGKLDPEEAVGYILQAARGLKFGHDLGMIHRDVKPDNLMLNDQGVVKVADLGLVKLPEADEKDDATKEPSRADELRGPNDMTQVGSAMGTPSFMAPEQGKDSASVDPRADIYSLGCTLYVLLTGKPPYEGTTAVEVMSKHATAPLVPPDVIVKRVPKELSTILIKMMAKKPEDRYANMDEVVAALERFLGVQSTGPFTPKEEHATALEECIGRYTGSSMARMRRLAVGGFFGVAAILLLSALFMGKPLFAAGVLAWSVLTPVFYLFIQGMMQKTYLFRRIREFVFGSRLWDWLTWAGLLLLLILALVLSNLYAPFLGAIIAAAAVAFLFHFVVDGMVERQRRGPLEASEKLFKKLRLQGLEEEKLRRFVCRYSGKDWEEFYEDHFGFEAKIQARGADRGETGKARAKHGTWREPIIAWLDAKQRARRQAREEMQLKASEAKALESQGMDVLQARRKAEEMAHVLVQEAKEIREAARKDAATAQAERARLRTLMLATRRPETVFQLRGDEPILSARWEVMPFLWGGKPRFIVGAILLMGCLLWVKQNELFTAQQLNETIEAAKETTAGSDKTGVVQAAKDLAKTASAFKLPDKKTKPLQVPGLPPAVADMFNSFNPGVAGLLLILSSFASVNVGVAVWVGALIALMGHRFGLPDLGPLKANYASMAVGAGVAVAGMIFLRRK